eukprot:gene18783-357_t
MDDVVEDKGRDDIVKLLLRHKADVNAVSIGIVKLLLYAGFPQDTLCSTSLATMLGQ